MASVERVVILLQGCIFDACGSYHSSKKDNPYSKLKLDVLINIVK